MSKQKAAVVLADKMVADPRDFTLDEIYRLVCRPPHQEIMAPDQLHRRCSRAIGEARRVLVSKGFRLILGERKNSYRAVRPRHYGGAA